MNFERRFAPYYLTQRINAKKEKGDKEKHLLVLKTILVTLALVGFLVFVVYRNFGTDVSNSSVPVQGSSAAASNIASQVTTNSESSTVLSIFDQEDALPLDPQISSLSSSLDTSTLNSHGPPYQTGHNLILFTGLNAIFAINPTDQELIADRLGILACRTAKSLYLSNDKMRIYFEDASQIKYFDFNDRSFTTYSPTNWDFPSFMLLKSEGNNIIYRAGISRNHITFNHYSLDESRVVYSYSHKCSWPCSPFLLEQTNDGSNILYVCYPFGEIFMKELNNSDEGHQRLFVLRGFDKAILGPDDSTLIMYNNYSNHWVIKNLESSNLGTKSKIIRFNVDISSFIFRKFSFSDDGSSLYAIREIEIGRNSYEYKLYTIDMQSLLENDYSNAASPYNLGEGRQITFTY